MDFAGAANAARIPVSVVPILAPSVSGNILSIDNIPTPTSGVRVEVKTELLCITMVTPEEERLHVIKSINMQNTGNDNLSI